MANCNHQCWYLCPLKGHSKNSAIGTRMSQPCWRVACYFSRSSILASLLVPLQLSELLPCRNQWWVLLHPSVSRKWLNLLFMLRLRRSGQSGAMTLCASHRPKTNYLSLFGASRGRIHAEVDFAGRDYLVFSKCREWPLSHALKSKSMMTVHFMKDEISFGMNY